MRIKLFLTICFLINSAKPLKDKKSSKKLNNEDTYSNAQEFKCVIIPPSENVTSVHKLKISDIKAVAALGDSLSTGLGADAVNFFKTFKDYRGLSFSAGGDESLETMITLPNIMKKYNQNLTGFSNDTNVFYRKSSNHFNVATSGSEVNFIIEQARELVERMKKSKAFDYKNDWKLITIFFGSLDLCDSCNDKKSSSVQTYISFIKQGLNILYNELPKSFVNVMAPIKVNKVSNVSLGILCTQLRMQMRFIPKR